MSAITISSAGSLWFSLPVALVGLGLAAAMLIAHWRKKE